MKHNNLDGKGQTPSLVCIKIFDTRIFVKHTRVLPRKVSVLRDTTTWTEKSDSPPLISIETFDTRNFLKHTRVLLKSFRTVRQQIFYTRSSSSALRYKFFRSSQNFPNTEGFLCEMIRYSETKQLGRKNWKRPLSSRTIFDARKIVKHRLVPLRSFSVL